MGLHNSQCPLWKPCRYTLAHAVYVQYLIILINLSENSQYCSIWMYGFDTKDYKFSSTFVYKCSSAEHKSHILELVK